MDGPLARRLKAKAKRVDYTQVADNEIFGFVFLFVFVFVLKAEI